MARVMVSRGRKPVPKVTDGRSAALSALPRCPAHLSPVARKEWRRLAPVLHDIGVLAVVDRAALAAYCQAYSRWVEAEQKLTETPMLLKTPSGYVQQSPWLAVANKQLEVMGRYMSELGLTPVARVRLGVTPTQVGEQVNKIEFVTIYTDRDGDRCERPIRGTPENKAKTISTTYEADDR